MEKKKDFFVGKRRMEKAECEEDAGENIKSR